MALLGRRRRRRRRRRLQHRSFGGGERGGEVTYVGEDLRCEGGGEERGGDAGACGAGGRVTCEVRSVTCDV
jgi:hypothetical protein